MRTRFRIAREFEMARRRIEEEAAQVNLFEEGGEYEQSLLEMP